MNRIDTPIALLAAIALCASAAPVALAGAASHTSAHLRTDATITAIRADMIHVGNGTRIEHGVVVIRDGRIVAIGADVAIPDGATVIEMAGASITPGLIDANAIVEPADLITEPDRRRRGVLSFMFDNERHAHLTDAECFMCDGTPLLACALAEMHSDLSEGQICPVCGGMSEADEIDAYASGVSRFTTQVEASSEVVPHTMMIDVINFRSPDFERLLRGGVTTIFVSPDSTAVIGPQGAVVRTAGPWSGRVIREHDAVKAAIGSEPYGSGVRNATPNRNSVTQRTRRPQSRMGVAYVFRKAFYDAERFAAGRPVEGPDQAPREALEIVDQIRRGEMPLRVHARTQRDILTALRLADEFGLGGFTLLEATEAYRVIDQIRQRNMAVVFGPIYMDPSGLRLATRETSENRLTTIRALLDAGIDTALSAQDLREEDGLARQAMYAMRAGLTFDEALRCVTETPARMLGLSDDIGTVEVGKRADLILWSGEPFAATSKPLMVLINGVVEFDANEDTIRRAGR